MNKKLIPAALAVAFAGACAEADRPLDLEVWYGPQQRVGHLGDAQPDFNLLGTAQGNEFSYRVNRGEAKPLAVYQDPWGFRRLGAANHFNADIPIESLEVGENIVEVITRNSEGVRFEEVSVQRVAEGQAELPFSIQWAEVASPQDVGQVVDGHWTIEGGSLQSKEPLYDRLFLIGNRTWQDYEILTSITVHAVPEENAPMSGGSGVGFIPRFTGHSVSPPRFPDVQPKWGYQPIGGIAWLRWTKGQPRAKPVRQFYRGDRDAFTSFEPLEEFELDRPFAMRASVITSPTDPATSTYRLRVWPLGGNEPSTWDFEVDQDSEEANRQGGVALVAHHVNVTFGDVQVTLPGAGKTRSER